MIRRQFIQRLAVAGTGGAAVIRTAQGGENKIVTYKVKGFTCVTCAVGLETLLRQEKGIVQAKASYPKADVVIEFNPAVVSEQALKAYIGEMGFSVQEG
jgi:copper chaperone CopZ